jgi:hypothetical protein
MMNGMGITPADIEQVRLSFQSRVWGCLPLSSCWHLIFPHDSHSFRERSLWSYLQFHNRAPGGPRADMEIYCHVDQRSRRWHSVADAARLLRGRHTAQLLRLSGV